MTSLVVRKVTDRGGVPKLKLVPVVPKEIRGGVGVVKRVRVICPACRREVEAVAMDGRVKGYCAVARQYVDFLAETQHFVPGKHFTAKTRAKISASLKKLWQDPEYRAKRSEAKGEEKAVEPPEREAAEASEKKTGESGQ